MMEKNAQNSEPNGAVAIIYRELDDNRQFLLASQKSGNVSLVGGGGEEFDDDLDATIEREMKEEIGLDSNQYSICKTEYRYTAVLKGGPRDGQTIFRQVYLAKVNSDLKITHNPSEIVGVSWVEEDEVLAKVTIDPLREVMEKVIRELAKN